MTARRRSTSGKIADWLRERVNADVTVRERFLDAHRADDLSEAFPGVRVLDPHDRDAPPREVLENQVEGEFLVENDPRTTAALKGYVLRAVHLAATGEGFCDDERCRLSNPHRHEGVVEAQLREPDFCAKHVESYGIDGARD
jgi:hypothetical protein